MAATTMAHIRVDEETKALAARTLDEPGLSVSDAVRLFLTRIVVEEGAAALARGPQCQDPRRGGGGRPD